MQQKSKDSRTNAGYCFEFVTTPLLGKRTLLYPEANKQIEPVTLT
jgi:hypothetical protein